MKLTLPKLFRSRSSEYYTAVDLGSSLVKVAIYKQPDQLEDIRLLGIGMQSQGLSTMQGGKIVDFDAAVETLNLALEEARLQAGVNSTEIVLGMSGDVILSKGLKVRVRRQDPEKVLDEEEFDILADQIEEQTLVAAHKELEGEHKLKLERVETTFTAYYLDGAKVKSPIGISGRELELGVLHYFAEPKRLSTINSLAAELGLEIVSLVNTSTSVAAMLIPEVQDFILVDIGGELTELVLVKGGKVAESEIFYMGGRDFTHQIQQDAELTFKDAEALKQDFARGHLDQERARTVSGSIEEAMDWWLEGAAGALSYLGKGEFPAVIFLTGGMARLGELKTALSSYPWNKKFNFVGFPKINILGDKNNSLEALAKLEL